MIEGHTFNSYSAGIDFIRQNLPSVVVDPSHRYSNESERPKMISNLNKPFASMIYTKLIQRFNG